MTHANFTHIVRRTGSSGAAGFTIVEFMLAMTFVSFLLVAIGLFTLQVGYIYTKGLTLREVNQVGRIITDDLRRSISTSKPFDVDTASTVTRYIVRPGGGRLCTGRYTYAWNYGEALAGGASAPSIYNTYDTSEPVHFAKVRDAGAALCVDPTTVVPRNVASEMLLSGDRDLALHSFDVTSNAEDTDTGQALYRVTLMIGTNNQDQLVDDASSCRPPSDNIGYEDYCAVNQFDIIVRAGNKAGGDE